MAQEQGSDELNEQEAGTAESPPEETRMLGGVDAETAELLRTLEMPAASGSEGDDAELPLAGVLRKPKKSAPGNGDPGDGSMLVEQLTTDPYIGMTDQEAVPDVSVPDVIAYEPIEVDDAWDGGDDEATVVEMPAAAPPADEGDDETIQVDPDEALHEDEAELVESVDFEDDIEEDLDEADIEELSSSDQLSVEEDTTPKAPPPPPRRGGAPPKPPPAPRRRPLKGEIVLTQDELAGFLAGGKNDEGTDLVDGSFPESTWWSDIFTEDYFRTLPKNFHKQTLREVEFIVDRLGLEPGARLLDLCCGFGRHTMELAKRDFDLVGLDLAMPLLQKALNEAQRRSLSIKFVHGDMRELSFESVFDGIFNVQTSFGYFDDQTNFKVLQGILRALKPGGRFLVEVINRDFVMDEIPMRIWWEGTECLILEEVDFDHDRSLLLVKRSFVFEDSGREPWEQLIQVRLYSSHELRNLMKRAGFEVIELSGDWTYPKAFFGAASQRVILVAERPLEEE